MSERCPEPSGVSCESGAPSDAAAPLSVSQRVALVLLSAYKTALSPLLMSCCKFHPTCSAYAREAIERHGTAHGSLLALRRVLRCRPFAPGGIDPVPENPGPADA